MNVCRSMIACAGILVGAVGCSSLQRPGESRILHEDTVNGGFVAALPEGGPIPRTGDTVRLFRTEFRGNPRQAQRAWVQVASGVIASIQEGRMRIRIVKGLASPGDRLLCCEPPSAADETRATERRTVSRGHAAQTGRPVTGTGRVAPALRDSLRR